jgi:hypothetical protein
VRSSHLARRVAGLGELRCQVDLRAASVLKPAGAFMEQVRDDLPANSKFVMA